MRYDLDVGVVCNEEMRTLKDILGGKMDQILIEFSSSDLSFLNS